MRISNTFAYLIGFVLFSTSVLQAQSDNTVLTLNIVEQSITRTDYTHSTGVNRSAPQGGQITLAHVGSFHHHNPFRQLGKASKESIYQFDTLLTPAPNHSALYHGLLAKDISLKNDRKTIAITLHPHARFADNSQVTAADVKASIETIIHDGPWHYHTLQQYHPTIQVVSPRSLTISLPTPRNLDTIIAFGHIPIAKKSTLQDSIPTGSGPYQLSKHTVGASSVLHKNPRYWAKNLPNMQGLFNFDNLKTLYYRNHHAAFEGFKRHEYDFRIEYYLENWQNLKTFQAKTPALSRQEVPQQKPIHMKGLVFNQQRDLWQDQSVRQALRDCFDFNTINGHLFQSQYQRIASYFTNTPYQSQISGPQTINNQQALQQLDQILSQRGWIIKNHQRVHQQSGQPLILRLLLPNKHNEKIASIFAKSLKTVGIATEILTHEGSQYIHSFRQGNYDLAYTHLEHNPLSVNSLKNVWTQTANSYNLASLAHIHDLHVLATLEKLSPPISNKEKIETLQQLAQHLIPQAYIIPFWYQDREKVAYWHNIHPPKNYHPKSTWHSLWQAHTSTN